MNDTPTTSSTEVGRLKAIALKAGAGANEAQLTDAEIARYAKLIYERTGIIVSPKKKLLLSNRIGRRLKATGEKNYDSYLRKLKNTPADDPEWDKFLQEITTHETYLFRDPQQWDWIRNTYLPEVAEQARSGKRKQSLRVWSAACSTGDEAYTIACCVADRLPNCAKWNIEIVGTDIGVGAVTAAKSAVFGERAMQHVPNGYRRRFFTKSQDGKQWSAKEVLTGWTKFYQHNLLDPLKEMPFDLIFLKNVLIYFDRESKKKVIQHVRPKLQPGGVIIAGGAEGVTDLLKDVERISAWMFRAKHSSGAGGGEK